MRFSVHTLTAAILSAMSFSALSQNADNQRSTGLEEIVVTAQRREQFIQSTPVAVTAISESQIADLQINTTQDVAKAVPNLQLIPVTANPSTFQVGLRGGSEQTGGLIVSEPVVGIYVDDVYRARLQGANAQLTDVERIEVLRGPQGTLYGRNSFSGAIKVVTRTPSADDSWMNFSVGGGSFDETFIRGSVGGGLSEELGASIAFLYRDQSDGWIFNRAQGRDIGAEENLALRAKLAWSNDQWRVVGSIDYGDDSNDGYIPTLISYTDGSPGAGFADRRSTSQTTTIPGFDEYVNQTPIDSRGETEQWGVSLDISRDFDTMTFRSITSYRDLDDLFRWDLTGGFQVGPDTFLPGFDRQSDATADQFTQEFQLQGSAMDGQMDWIAGLYYFTESGQQVFTDGGIFFTAVTGSPFIPLPAFRQNIDSDSIALFTQATYDLSDQLSITGGLRFTQDNKKFEALIDSPVNLAVNLDEDFDAWTPKLGLEYTFSDDLFGYVSVSRGFKAGGFNGLTRDPAVLNVPYDPQFSWSYEAGIKADWFDGLLRTNATVFLNQLEDLQQVASAQGGAFPVQNVGDADITGLELEISAAPMEGLNLFANIGLMDDDYGSLRAGAAAATSGAVGLPLVADWTAQIGAMYETPISEKWWLRVGADYRAIDDYFVNVQNNLEIDGYGRLDAFVAFRSSDEKWELALQGRNLTDDASYVSGALIDALTMLRPRTYSVTLSYRQP
ncbi:MAG: TonB-dependent receptor [Lysobacterales bacterium]